MTFSFANVTWYDGSEQCSTSSLFFQFCYDILCPPFQYEPQKDVFNAAQSGAMVPNLVTHEFDYLYKQLTSVR